MDRFTLKTVECIWNARGIYLERTAKIVKPTFHIVVSNVRIVSAAGFFVKPSGNTLAIVSNNPYVRSDSIVPIELCSILASETIKKSCLAIVKF